LATGAVWRLATCFDLAVGMRPPVV
jgi:hypothetical protein